MPRRRVQLSAKAFVARDEAARRPMIQSVTGGTLSRSSEGTSIAQDPFTPGQGSGSGQMSDFELHVRLIHHSIGHRWTASDVHNASNGQTVHSNAFDMGMMKEEQ